MSILITKFRWIVWIGGVKQWFEAEWNVAMPIAFSHPVRTSVEKLISPPLFSNINILENSFEQFLKKEPLSTDVEHDTDNGHFLYGIALLTNLTLVITLVKYFNYLLNSLWLNLISRIEYRH